ncbi:(E3-independent) E2 ubiquitin-conjugating enzyme UBE2O-like [Antedon mediterranea]|uniref:(E3-independent) E2 ubiquitin-conjugating enzyme UBE2O-like n=1 Tax=Antedon mediterranea TaxID=105859 RepID=UPI003AF527D5
MEMAKLFVEDVVVKRLRGGKYQFGLVVTNYETFDSDEESDNEEEFERVNPGQVRVAWYPKGNEEVVDDSKITLYDRSLMPGDVVYSLKSGGTQCGFVKSVNILCHLRIFKTKQMIYDVDSKDLNQIMEFQHGDHVVFGYWLGTIREVSSELIIKLQNGARYIVTDEGASKLTDVHDNSEEFSVFTGEDGYYPGQVLHGPSSVFKKAKWLSGTKPIMGNKTNFRGTVEKVKVTSVEVHWQTRGLCINETFNNDELFKPPDKKIEGDALKELKVLQQFKAACVQIGDKAMYTVKTEKIVHPQHVVLGSLYCFKQPETTPKTSDKQSQKEDPPEEDPEENDPLENDMQENDPLEKDQQEKGPQEEYPQNDVTEEDQKEENQQGPQKIVEESIIVKKNKKAELIDKVNKLSDILQEIDLEETSEEDTKKPKEESGVSVEDNTDNGKSAEASAIPLGKTDGKLDLDLLRDIHKQLLSASEDIAKIGDINKTSGEPQKMDPHIVKLLQSRNEINEQIALIEGLIKGTDDLHLDVKEKGAERKRGEGHQKSGTARAVKTRSGRNKRQPVTAGEEVCVEVTHTSTVVDVIWQDGKIEKNIRSSQLSPMNQMDELEFFPGDFVSQSENIEEGVYGLISSANHQDRTCTVRWYKRPMQEDQSIPQYTHTEESSVYDLMSHTDFTFNTGDIVVRVGDTNQEGLHEVLPSAGQVLWVNTEGTVEVVWVDNTTTTVLPQDLYKLDEDSDSDWSENEEDEGTWHLDSHSIEGTESSWETASEGSDDQTTTNSFREQDNSVVDEQNERNAVNARPIEGEATSSRSEIITEANHNQPNETTRLLTSNDTPSKSVCHQSESDKYDSANATSKGTIDIDDVDLSVSETEMVGTEYETTKRCGDEVGKSAIATSITDNSEQSDKFISVETIPANHIFAKSVHTPIAPKRFLSAVQKEISLLQCSLPVGILVKAFEDRMDLFSVLIEGPKNTPYEDALFHFDVRLPSDYPRVPPILHYHSYCSMRLNPNLYEDGKVCISLLGTWTGKHDEMWNSKSTLLQVLVSVQGLILVAEPYYNEAGFEKHRGSSLGEENSHMYNEMTLLKVVQSMTKMLINPPIVFKDEVIDFCRKHNTKLIQRIEYWLEVDGASSGSTKPVSPDSVKPVSPDSVKPGLPAFPLLPFSKGFLLSIQQALKAYKTAFLNIAQ